MAENSRFFQVRIGLDGKKIDVSSGLDKQKFSCWHFTKKSASPDGIVRKKSQFFTGALRKIFSKVPIIGFDTKENLTFLFFSSESLVATFPIFHCYFKPHTNGERVSFFEYNDIRWSIQSTKDEKK